jgi:hypothetical protein
MLFMQFHDRFDSEAERETHQTMSRNYFIYKSYVTLCSLNRRNLLRLSRHWKSSTSWEAFWLENIFLRFFSSLKFALHTTHCLPSRRQSPNISFPLRIFNTIFSLFLRRRHTISLLPRPRAGNKWNKQTSETRARHWLRVYPYTICFWLELRVGEKSCAK